MTMGWNHEPTLSEHIDTKRDPAYLGGYLDAMKDRDKQEAERQRAERGEVRTANGVWRPSDESGIPITVTQPDDPAYALLQNPNIFSTPVVHRRGCYICEDPEFAQMGLPLCRKCPICRGHIAADDSTCDDCGFDEYDAWAWRQDPTSTSPYFDLSVDECWP